MIALYLSLVLIIAWVFVRSRESEYFTDKEKLQAAIKKFI